MPALREQHTHIHTHNLLVEYKQMKQLKPHLLCFKSDERETPSTYRKSSYLGIFSEEMKAPAGDTSAQSQTDPTCFLKCLFFPLLTHKIFLAG